MPHPPPPDNKKSPSPKKYRIQLKPITRERHWKRGRYSSLRRSGEMRVELARSCYNERTLFTIIHRRHFLSQG
jgi:hypothetical protein